jgi:sec-independent protein translocase protein TatA
MMGLSIQHLLLLLVVVLLLFGRGKLSELMGDVGKGIRSFKAGLAEDDAHAVEEPLAPSSSAISSRAKTRRRVEC